MSTPSEQAPRKGAFFQQKLKAWQPIYSPKWVIATIFAFGVILIAIGIPILIASNNVIEYSIQYDGKNNKYPSCHIDVGKEANCQFTIKLDQDMIQPIYLYYGLDNFYQNHRRYVQSRDDDQLRGKSVSDSTLESNCAPLYKDSDGKILYPCGLIANTMFNDSFSIERDGGSIDLFESGIAWPSDVKDKFANPDPPLDRSKYKFLDEVYPGIITMDKESDEKSPQFYGGGVQNEHFVVWMRVAALPNFRKLYGIIRQDLRAGETLTIDISLRFPVSQFDGKKYIVLSTMSWIGGKNSFLGICYITVGSIAIVVGIAFLIKYIINPRNLGDISRLNYDSQ